MNAAAMGSGLKTHAKFVAIDKIALGGDIS